MRNRRALVGATSLALFVAVLGGAAQANHVDRACTISPTTAAVGDRITVRGSTNTAGETFSMRLGGTEIDSGTTDTGTNVNGHFEEDARIPTGTTGSPAVTVVAPSGTLPCGTVTIAAPTPTPTPSPTPDDDDADSDNTPRAPTGGARLNVLGNDEFRAGESGKATAVAVTPNENYVLDFAQSPGTVIARATANRHGTVRFEFRIPSSARRGRATLTALPADGSGLRASAAITIVNGSGGGGGGGRSLPATGRNVIVSALFAVLLVLGGLMMQRFEWLRR